MKKIFKKRRKIVISGISNHNTIKPTEFFFQFVSLFGQIGTEKLQNPLLKENSASSFIYI